MTVPPMTVTEARERILMPIIDPNPASSTTAPSGWMCYTCGKWVPNSVVHSCSGVRPVPVESLPERSVTWSLIPDADVERIARRVVELLREAES